MQKQNDSIDPRIAARCDFCLLIPFTAAARTGRTRAVKR